MRQYIKTCIEIEKTIARIYRIFQDSSQFDTELRRIFFALANDEDDHARQLEFAMRIPSESFVPEHDIPPLQAEALLSKAEALHQKVSSIALSPIQAVDLGIELESDFCSIHLSNSVRFKEESMRKMFAAMARSEDTHKAQLQKIKVRLDLPRS